MSTNTNITIGGHFSQFVENKIKEGRFETAGEAVRAGLHLLEVEESRLEMLRSTIASEKAQREQGFGDIIDSEAVNEVLGERVLETQSAVGYNVNASEKSAGNIWGSASSGTRRSAAEKAKADAALSGSFSLGGAAKEIPTAGKQSLEVEEASIAGKRSLDAEAMTISGKQSLDIESSTSDIRVDIKAATEDVVVNTETAMDTSIESVSIGNIESSLDTVTETVETTAETATVAIENSVNAEAAVLTGKSFGQRLMASYRKISGNGAKSNEPKKPWSASNHFR